MRFNKAQPTVDLHLRWTSETEQWQVGLKPMLFGVRVRAGRTCNACFDIAYCAGKSVAFQQALLIVVVIILESFPESIGSSEIAQIMPEYRRKPISEDPCWQKLQDLALAINQQELQLQDFSGFN
ncbi:hypothetical protein ACQ4M3_12970 [Leptolyngbya sp. AN03gr2]|uniref:hypothetical protein n=1 Tax=unclassified Leptolyngbya TaxID=2650499 RepID=UPI003D317584